MSTDGAQRRRTRISARIATGLLLACLLPPLAAAANRKPPQDYALIFGTVWSAQPRPLPGVKIKIRRVSDKKARWELVSDARGEFAHRVPPEKADYVVWAEIKGHKGPAAETQVHIEANERQDIALHLTE